MLRAKLVRWLLVRNLDVEESNLLTAFLLDKLGALPYREIVGVSSEGELTINGQELEPDQVANLRESAKAVLANQAFNLICEHVMFLAVTQGVHKAETPAQMYWGRVGVWWAQNLKKSLETLAQRQELGLSEIYKK